MVQFPSHHSSAADNVEEILLFQTERTYGMVQSTPPPLPHQPLAIVSKVEELSPFKLNKHMVQFPCHHPLMAVSKVEEFSPFKLNKHMVQFPWHHPLVAVSKAEDFKLNKHMVQSPSHHLLAVSKV